MEVIVAVNGASVVGTVAMSLQLQHGDSGTKAALTSHQSEGNER